MLTLPPKSTITSGKGEVKTVFGGPFNSDVLTKQRLRDAWESKVYGFRRSDPPSGGVPAPAPMSVPDGPYMLVDTRKLVAA